MARIGLREFQRLHPAIKGRAEHRDAFGWRCGRHGPTQPRLEAGPSWTIWRVVGIRWIGPQCLAASETSHINLDVEQEQNRGTKSQAGALEAHQ